MKENMHVQERVLQLLTHSSAIFSNRQSVWYQQPCFAPSPCTRNRQLRAVAMYAQSPCTRSCHPPSSYPKPQKPTNSHFPRSTFPSLSFVLTNENSICKHTHTHTLSLSLSLSHTHTFLSLTLTHFFLSQSTQVIFTFFFICLLYPSPCVIVFCCCFVVVGM
jgi:hypothetical protein